MDIYNFTQEKTTNKAITDLIQKDSISSNKAFMATSERYYNSQNDISNKDFRKYVANGTEKINYNRSNQRISHNFFKLLVNQAVNYITGNAISYKHIDKQFQEYLDKFLMFVFDDMCVEWLKEARKKGRGYLHFYYDLDGKLNFAVIPAEQIIPIYKDSFKKELDEVVRYYSVPGVEGGKEVVKKRVEVWTSTDVSYYSETADGDFVLSDQMSHWSYTIDTIPDYVEPMAWGRVPFIELRNNIEGTSDLLDIKQHIDAYDLIQSEFINQIADVREILIKVLGYSGTDVEEIMKIFRSTGIVKIDDATGNIDVLKTEIPVEAREKALDRLKQNIFVIGQGVDSTNERFGTTSSGIALKMLYAPLDLKCSATIRKMMKSLYEFMWFITEDYNRKFGKSINYLDINFTFSKNMMINEAEIIESLVKSKGLISDETITEKHPYVDDPILETERLLKQSEKELEQFNQQVMQNRDQTNLE